MRKPAPPTSLPSKGAVPVVVGIGASAGGLDPLERFLARVSPDSGLAFVVVQHLEPASDGLICEILQRTTRMPVLQATDLMPVQKDTVYVIPPNRYLSLLHGVLHLFEPPQSGSLRLPVDFFLRSLAQDRKERSVAVILSGMGYDGTLGGRAVKEKGGVLLVQDPTLAKYPSMPRSVIESLTVDFVGGAEELAATLGYLPSAGMVHEVAVPGVESALDKIVILLRDQTGHDFSSYKRSTLRRRLQRRMEIHRIDSLQVYIRYLQQNPQELEHLFREFLIGVTSFFRDPAGWEVLERVVIPQLVARRSPGEALRVWAAGCSTGEEAYSLAIAFHEAMGGEVDASAENLQIFATDLDPKAIEHARNGIFPAAIAEDLADGRLRRYFVEEGGYFRVRKEIREMITFAAHNLLMDPPFLRLDLLVCRNLLIYLETSLQKKLIPLFHYALKPEGFVFLGQAESVGAATGLFAPVDCATRIFRRIETGQSALVEFPPSVKLPQPARQQHLSRVPNLQGLAEQLILHQYGPPAILARENGDILFISGSVGPYLEFASGKANLNLFAMIRGELRPALATGFTCAGREGEAATQGGIPLTSEGQERLVDLTVERLTHPGPLRDMVLVVFRERAALKHPEPNAAGRLAELERELQQTREALQLTREEIRHSQEALYMLNEELQSANEELLSANEELHFTNEELTISKVEAHLVNRELQRLNSEQEEQFSEISSSRDELARLLDHAGFPSIYLDRELCVRHYSSSATDLFRLIPGDVGRPLADLAGSVYYDHLDGDVRRVLRTGIPVETWKASPDGRRFAVRISRCADGSTTDGVVLSFYDLSPFLLALQKGEGSQICGGSGIAG